MKYYPVLPPKLILEDDEFRSWPLMIEASFIQRYPKLGDLLGFHQDWILDFSPNVRGKDINVKEYIELIKIIHPPQVVVPDCLGDKQETLRLARQFFLYLWDPSLQDYIVPVQGKNVDECLECQAELEELLEEYEIENFKWGIPYRFSNVGGPSDREQARQTLIEVLRPFTEKKIHLLGLWDPSIIEASELYVEGDSVDSSYALQYARLDAFVSQHTSNAKSSQTDYWKKLDSSQKRILWENCTFLQNRFSALARRQQRERSENG